MAYSGGGAGGEARDQSMAWIYRRRSRIDKHEHESWWKHEKGLK